MKRSDSAGPSQTPPPGTFNQISNLINGGGGAASAETAAKYYQQQAAAAISQSIYGPQAQSMSMYPYNMSHSSSSGYLYSPQNQWTNYGSSLCKTTSNANSLMGFDPSQPPPPPLPTEPDSNAHKPPLPLGLPPDGPSFGLIRGRGRGGNTFLAKRNQMFQHRPMQAGSSYQMSKRQCFDASVSGEAEHDRYTLINKKNKRKPMSTRYTRTREWNREDAVKALELEKEYNRLQRTPMLILKFPDPELNKFIVKKYSPAIESVHFQQPSTPRYCFVQVKQGTDVDKLMEELSAIPFGTGHITAERKNQHFQENSPVTPEEIDPYTLYIGNLPTQISTAVVKSHFPGAQRIDIGYAQRMKYTRYAFIRYNNLEESMNAYKHTFNMLIDSRSLIVRFRRQKGNMGLPGETKIPNTRKEAPVANKPDVVPDSVEKTEDKKDKSEIKSSVSVKDFASLSENDDATSSKDEKDNKTTPWSAECKDLEAKDSKANVLEEAQRLLQSSGADLEFPVFQRRSPTQPPRLNSRLAASLVPLEVKSEPAPGPYDMQSTDSDDIFDSDLMRGPIKDEPLDDDELLEQAERYGEMIYGDDIEGDPEEEEEDSIPSDYSDRPTSFFKTPIPNWEEFRRNELSRKETKPKFDLSDTSAHFGRKSEDIDKLLADSGDKDGKKDELDDLFRSITDITD